MRRLRPLAALVIGAAVLLSPRATPAEASHSWGGYHWARTANPFAIKLGDNVSATWRPYLNSTAAAWSASSVLDTTTFTGQAKGNCRPTNGRVEVCSGSYGNNGWLGLAQIWLSSGHISQGTVKVNDTYFSLPLYNTPEERSHVMCQEIGHTFGLGHTSEDGTSQQTCMDYSTDPKSTAPNTHDFAQLESIYGHSDASTTIKQPPANIAQGDFDHPSEWGRRVRSAAGGRGAIFERDFGGGHKLETFVIFAN